MNSKLSFKDTMYIGMMLFGLFFGAGNIIFPIAMGQQAGGNVWLAVVGFLITSVGLPLLGIIGLGLSQSSGVFFLAKKVNKTYGYIFTVLLYLVIGPFFAIPRLATTSFQIGFAPFISEGQIPLFLGIFSVVFFGATYFFATRPGKIMTYVGKYLTPIFLILLGIILLFVFLKPMGSLGFEAQGAYQTNAVLKGFTEGYNTMDALASLAFGVIVVDSIRRLGINKPKDLVREMSKSGIVALILMGVIYLLLALMGTLSLNKFGIAPDGGTALAEVARFYMGDFGNILLAVLILIACLKTAIGLVTSFGEAMNKMFPNIPYKVFMTVAAVLPAIFANVGLSKIVEYSTPVLMFIYPLAVALIFISLLTPILKPTKCVYGMTTLFTLIPAIFDLLSNAPKFISGTSFVKAIVDFATKYLPLYNLGLGWVVPALIGLIIGIVLQKLSVLGLNKEEKTS